MGNKIARRRQAVEDRYTRPQGLYEHRDIDYKKLRRLILDSKLAPCYPGEEDCAIDLEECPICFLYYPSLNRSRCCVKGICTECFLQMKPHQSTSATQCPFCKTSNYAVEYRGVRTKEEKGMDQIEEQKVIEAQIRMQQQELQDEEERRLRRQSLMRPSSRITTTEEVENLDLSCRSLSVQSSRFPTQGNELVSQGSSTTPTSRRFSHPRYNRDGGFEMDLEDLMVMEAIWLSIQEPENQLHHSLPVSSQLCTVPGREASPSGGLALAVAALAERQHLRAEPSESASRVDRARVTNHPPERWTEVPLDSESLSCREDGNWETDHESEVHSMAGNAADGSIVASPLPIANDMTVDHLPPESFNEQMMLAMAVSLAEARARTSAPPLTWM
ncbi:putative transcription factor C2H2 family [Dioscorea sansibarensis]